MAAGKANVLALTGCIFVLKTFQAALPSDVPQVRLAESLPLSFGLRPELSGVAR
jgi:hypothetical protein